jgi:hypothetical protein
MVILYKICSVVHQESNKIRFAFFWFFYDFLQILQDPAKLLYYLRNNFACRLLELLSFHRYAPNSQKLTWKDLVACNVALGLRRRRFRPKSGEPAAQMAREKVGKFTGLT